MPLLDYSVWATWQLLYDLQATPERVDIRLSYHRAVLFNSLARTEADMYVAKLGWQPSWRIGIVGCGFGWTVEHLEQRYGFSNIIGIDVSQFIQTNKSGTEEADINAAIAAVGLSPTVGEGASIKARIFDGGPRSRASRSILNENGNTNQSRNRIRQALGGNTNFDVGLSEDVLEALTDVECIQASGFMHQYCDQVQHLVSLATPEQVARMDPAIQGANWKATLAAWKTLLPNDTFMAAGTYEVL